MCHSHGALGSPHGTLVTFQSRSGMARWRSSRGTFLPLRPPATPPAAPHTLACVREHVVHRVRDSLRPLGVITRKDLMSSFTQDLF